MITSHRQSIILLALLLFCFAVPAIAQQAAGIDLAINKTGPVKVNAGDDVAYTLVVTNPIDRAVQAAITDTLPAGWNVISINSPSGNCSGAGTGTATCHNVDLPGSGNQGPSTTQITVMVHVPFRCQPTVLTNTATVTAESNAQSGPIPDPNPTNNISSLNIAVTQPNLGPGSCVPSNSAINSTKPGSILFAGLYASGAISGDPQNNTRVNLTNVHPNLGVAVHLFFVDGDSCSIADTFICLTPNQTTSFFMSDLDPGVQGYMMAIAVDGPPGTAGGTNTGCPISFNYLIGNANIKFTGSPRRDLDLESESVASEFGSPVPTCDPNKPFAELYFDGSPRGYNQLPRVLAVSSIPSRADGNDTMLMIARVDGNWGTGIQPIGAVTGLLYDDAETAFSFSFNVGACLLRSSLSNNFPRTAPRFETVIPAGRSGWMKFWAANENAAIIGAVHNRNDNSQTAPGAFEGGRNLHVLRLLPSAVITVPVFPPSC